MNFAEKVKQLRQQKGLTQKELGQKIGVSLRTVIYWEQGKTLPRQDWVYPKLAVLFGVSEEYLRGEDEDFILAAEEQYGDTGRRQAMRLVNKIGGMYAGGDLSEEDMRAVLEAMQESYFKVKLANRKYASNPSKDDVSD